MKIEVLSKRENPLLDRKEVRFSVEYDGPTPKLAVVKKEILATLKSDGKLTVIDSLKPTFGKRLLTGYAKVYGDENAMKIEPEYRIKKNAAAEEKPAEAVEEKPAEAAEEKPEGAAEEKPAEAAAEAPEGEAKE